MSVNKVDKTTGNTTLIAGSTLWADSPIGSILPYGGNTAPSGWMICDGSALSRTTPIPHNECLTPYKSKGTPHLRYGGVTFKNLQSMVFRLSEYLTRNTIH